MTCKCEKCGQPATAELLLPTGTLRVCSPCSDAWWRAFMNELLFECLSTLAPSAYVAKSRLRTIVAVDRAAVPCGRWVFAGGGFHTSMWGESGITYHPPRYRWEVRR